MDYSVSKSELRASEGIVWLEIGTGIKSKNFRSISNMSSVTRQGLSSKILIDQMYKYTKPENSARGLRVCD